MSRVILSATICVLVLGLVGCGKQTLDIIETPELKTALDMLEKTNVGKDGLLTGIYEPLMKDMEEALAADPSNPRPRLMIGIMKEREFKYREALACYQQVHREHTNMSEPFIGAGYLYYDVAIGYMALNGQAKTGKRELLAVFRPDDTARAILHESKRLLLKSKEFPIGTNSENGMTSIMFDPVDERLAMIDNHLAKSSDTPTSK